MKRVVVLLVVAVVIGLVMARVDGVRAFDSPIYPVMQAPPLPSDGETVTIGGEWGDQVGGVVETQAAVPPYAEGGPVVQLCVGLTSGHVICYEVW